jgi:hypothetical protein
MLLVQGPAQVLSYEVLNNQSSRLPNPQVQTIAHYFSAQFPEQNEGGVTRINPIIFIIV